MKYFEKSSESNKKDYTTTGVVGGSTAAVLALPLWYGTKNI